MVVIPSAAEGSYPLSSYEDPSAALGMTKIKMKQFFVYFVTNWTNEVLYTGVTSALETRNQQHKKKMIEGFTKKYNADKLVYFEEFHDAENAIKREKQIKKWSRKKKDYLVNLKNPEWRDLSLEWYCEDPSAALGMTVEAV